MRRSQRDKDDPAYQEAKRAFAELGFDLDRDSVDAHGRRLGLPDPRPDDPYAYWESFVAAAAPDARDPWRDDDLDPAAWSPAIPVEIAGDFELDPFDLTLELEQPIGRAELDALSTVTTVNSHCSRCSTTPGTPPPMTPKRPRWQPRASSGSDRRAHRRPDTGSG